jgi:hypothetical protein
MGNCLFIVACMKQVRERRLLRRFERRGVPRRGNGEDG